MAHYECRICGEVLCEDPKCGEEKQKQYAEHRRLLAGIQKDTPVNTDEFKTRLDQHSATLSTQAAQIQRLQGEGDIRIVLTHENAVIPALGTELSAGYDLYAVEDITLEEDEIKAIPLGFSAALPHDLHARIESRSGKALQGLIVVTGVIDADYRGEWKVILANYSALPQTVEAGTRIAQMVLRPTIHRDFVAVKALESTVRGAGGFGSTGQ